MRKLIVVLAIVAIGVVACRPQPQYYAERPWGQGYETQQGYMQPDHGWFYYWMLYHTFQNPQPTYHVYQAPIGYPPAYRPWHGQAPRVYVTPPSILPPSPTTRSSGGFSQSATPAAPPTTTRSSGGFSGFSRPATTSPPATRSSGGFSSPRVTTSSPSTTTRSSGGFSAPSRPSSPSPSSRSSGGFSSRPSSRK